MKIKNEEFGIEEFWLKIFTNRFISPKFYILNPKS